MTLEHSCFVSYCHGHGPLMRSFIEQLVEALDAYIEPWLEQKVWIDRTRLEAGHLYNEAIARDLCQSVCMVAVLVPRYFESDYCRREFEAMRRVEAERFRRLGGAPANRGLIIPILFRGEGADLPEPIRRHRHYCDFGGFTTARSDKLLRNRDFIEKIEAIARFVAALHKSLADASMAADECDQFRLPTSNEALVALAPTTPRAPETLLFREARP